MSLLMEYTAFVLCALFLTSLAAYDPFMDTVWFKMAWPGILDTSNLPSGDAKSESTETHSVVMTTKDNEKYKCFIPQVKSQKDEGETAYQGPDEMTLLQPLFQQKSCSYRIETYWTYELCHGQFFHQYHDEKDAVQQKTKRQEYYLGYYQTEAENSEEETSSKSEEIKRTEKPKSTAAKPVKKIDGVDMPYFTVNMTKGTPCDLSKEQRSVAIHYICQPHGKGEIYEFKEVSTCVYEATVLTFLLCGHPDYQPKKKKVNEIQCHSVDGSPKRPVSLDALIKDSLDMQDPNQEDFLDEDNAYSDADYDEGDILDMPNKEDENASEQEDETPKDSTPDPEEEHERTKTTISVETDKEVMRTFLSGEYCLVGGAGWWRHELCYGKHVKQFHENEDNTRIDIKLGTWNLAEHNAWLLKNPSKLPKPANKRKHISQFYSFGETCDLTGKPRNVEVKLTCKENAKQPHSITVYLIEPNTCEYVLVVESQLMCEVIAKADDSGIIAQPPS